MLYFTVKKIIPMCGLKLKIFMLTPLFLIKEHTKEFKLPGIFFIGE
jgi:hypothetical protein